MRWHLIPAGFLFIWLIQTYSVASEFVRYQFGYADGVLSEPPRHMLPEWLSAQALVWMLALLPFAVLLVLAWSLIARHRRWDAAEQWWLAARLSSVPTLAVLGLLWWNSWEVTNPFTRRPARAALPQQHEPTTGRRVVAARSAVDHGRGL